jgi:regulatory protein
MPFARPKKREPVGEDGLFEYAVGSLARRPRSERDLRRLMAARAHPGDEGKADMDRVIARLKDLNYLSDPRFAADYTRLRKENQGFGRRRVQQDLAQKGLAKDLVATTLEAAYADTDELALARQFCERKRLKPPANEKETARTLRRLVAAGFSTSTIWKLLRSWNAPDSTLAEVEAIEIPEPSE